MTLYNRDYVEECCVCLEDFEKDVQLHTLPCGHFFHCHCIQQWFQGHNFCPLCKLVLTAGVEPQPVGTIQASQSSAFNSAISELDGQHDNAPPANAASQSPREESAGLQLPTDVLSGTIGPGLGLGTL